MQALRPANCQVIVNPSAGAGAGRRLRALRLALEGAGIDYTWPDVRSAGAARVVAAAPGPPVIAAGGDGTVREVAQGLVVSGRPLLIYPIGTENLAAHGLGFGPDPRQTVGALVHGAPLAIDGIGHATGLGLVVAGIGFDAEAVQRLADRRRTHGDRLDYVWPLWRTFCGSVPPYLEIVADGRPVFAGHGLAFVANMPGYAWGLRLAPAARPDDGLLDLRVFPARNRRELLGWAARTVVRRHAAAPHARARMIEVSGSPEIAVHLDGEPAGRLPACFTAQPAALTVLRTGTARVDGTGDRT